MPVPSGQSLLVHGGCCASGGATRLAQTTKSAIAFAWRTAPRRVRHHRQPEVTVGASSKGSPAESTASFRESKVLGLVLWSQFVLSLRHRDRRGVEGHASFRAWSAERRPGRREEPGGVGEGFGS